jgi:hypothetical protein
MNISQVSLVRKDSEIKEYSTVPDFSTPRDFNMVTTAVQQTDLLNHKVFLHFLWSKW